MNYKKLSIAILVLMLILSGCVPFSVPVEEQQILVTPVLTEPAASKVQPFSLKIAAGNSDGLWYLLASSVSTQVTSTIPQMNASAKATAGVMDNLKLVTTGKAGMAFGYDYHVILANQGKLASAFPNAEPEKLTIKCGVEITRPAFPDYAQSARIVMALYEQPLQIVTTDAAGIATLNEIQGRRISTGPVNSGTEEQAGYVLKAMGMDWDKDIIREQLGFAESVTALKDGKIDAFFWSGAPTESTFMDLSSESDLKIRILPIDGEDAEKIMQFNQHVFHKSKISAGSYNGMESDVDTLAVTVVLIAMQDFPADLMKQIVSTIFENKAETAAVWKDIGGLTPELSMAQLSVESRSFLHEGSAEYFKEQGLLP